MTQVLTIPTSSTFGIIHERNIKELIPITLERYNNTFLDHSVTMKEKKVLQIRAEKIFKSATQPGKKLRMELPEEL